MTKLCLVVFAAVCCLVGCTTFDGLTASQSTACTNGVRDTGELGVDCGPVCNNICDGQACGTDAECKSGKCTGGSCGASAGKTCGVGLPNACNNGQACGVDADCTTDYCNNTCTAPSGDVHTDGRRDGDETGIDCGGPAPACAAGQACKTNDDCVGACTTLLCGAPSGSDGKKDGDESDVDCGGATAPKCDVGKMCGSNADCQLDACTAGKCVTPTSVDGVKNGGETDTDCGGNGVSGDGITYQAPRCTVEKACLAGADCLTGACSPGQKCEVASCATSETAGITTCGLGETGAAGAVHDSCCTSLVEPTRTTMRLDKYEITAGRYRAFLASTGPDLQVWTANYAAAHPTSQLATALASFPVLKTILPKEDIEDDLSLTAHLSFDIDNYDGVRGCFNGTGSFAANTYWQDDAHLKEFGIPTRPTPRTTSDEKPLNCAMPLMLATFCAWDGGELATAADYADVWPPTQSFPWGPTNLCTKGGGQGAPPLSGTNGYFPCDAYNWCNGPTMNGGFTCQDLTIDTIDEPGIFYEYPRNTDRSNDNEPLIAAPGRFPQDVTALKSANGDGWHDLFANLAEYTGDFAVQAPTTVNPTPNAELATFCDRSSDPLPGASLCTRQVPEDGSTATGTLFSNIPQVGIVGSTWEGHQYGPGIANFFPATFQYGKFGARCVRPAAAY